MQTIHAFCTRLLHQFPFEANVAARFTRARRAQRARAARPGDHRRAARRRARSRQRRSAARSRPRSAPPPTPRSATSCARRSAERDAVTAWIARAGGVDAAIAELARALGIAPDDTLERDRGARSSTGRSCRPREWASVADAVPGKLGQRPEAVRAPDRRGRRGRRGAARGLSVGLPHRQARAARKIDRHRRARASGIRGLAERLARRAGAPRSRCSSGASAVVCRDRTAALLTIADAVIARYRAEKDRRGLLDYDDLIDKTLALLAHGQSALGALQARSRHRPRADRRGAGHQPGAVGDHRAAGRRIHRRRRRARQRQAHDLRGRRREAVDLLVPGRGAAQVRRDAAALRARVRQRRARLSRPCSFQHSFRSAPNVLGAVDAVFSAARASIVSVTADADGMPPHEALPRRRARPGRALAADRAGRAARDRRLGRAVRRHCRRRARRCGSRSSIARTVRDAGSRAATSVGSDRRARCAPATCWCWCASAARCSRRSSAR